MIGKVIQGRYHLERLLGEGGFGAVYQAEDVKFERLVAVKLLHQTAKSNPDHAQRFITEAKITSQLSHRNIPVVYEYGESEEGQLFIVTELFTGASLEEIIDEISLSPRQASWIANEVNEALVVAHQKGITHRDVKPPNIYIHQGSSGEEVKLLDFGIAKISNTQSHTLTGQLFGTPYFMSPEQILGQKNISPATDMYSLGAVLFYCLTRTVPYDGDSQFMIFNKHVNAPTPSLVERAPYLDHIRLQELINCLMEKKPEDRPRNSQEARELFTEIEYVTTLLDRTPRQNPLQFLQRNGETQLKGYSSYDSDHLPHLKTPLATQPQVPAPLALTGGFFDMPSDHHLDEIVTLPPLDDHWRPTAKLDISEIENPLLGDDDTTDNMRRSAIEERRTLTNISASRYDSEQVTQLSVTPLMQQGSMSQDAFTSQDVQFFERGLEELTGTVDKPTMMNRFSIASLVFVIGILISLFFSENPSDTSNQNQVSVVSHPIASSDTLNQPLDQSVVVSLPLPVETVDIDSSVLELPVTEELALPIVTKAPTQTKRRTTAKSTRHAKSKRKKSKKIHSSQRSGKENRQKKRAKRSFLSKRSVKRSKGAKAQQVSKVTLRVIPHKPSYLTGDKIRLSSSAYMGTKVPIKAKLNYTLIQTNEGNVKKSFSVNSLTLQQGTWQLKACAQKVGVCSGAVKLIVYDPSSLINLDE
jgi:serine/threonine protein kinase